MKFIVDFLINGPERLSAWFAWLPPLFARIVVGWVFLWSGWGKLNALDRITQNFVEWGIPFPSILTPFVSGVEFVAGSLLIVGFLSSLASLVLLGDMFVAILTTSLSAMPKGLSPLNWLDDFLYLPEVLYVLFFIWLICSGPGRFSVDHWLASRLGK